MSDKRNTTIQARVSDRERELLDAVARKLRRNRSDAIRIIVLEKAEMLGLIPAADQSTSDQQKGEA